jgi:hypothetical protein
MRSSSAGTAQTFYDVRRGMNEQDSTGPPLHRGKTSMLYRFPLPEAEYRIIRFGTARAHF